MTADPDDAPTPNPSLTISNEFGQVDVRKVATRNGERLEVRDRETGSAIRLDALELESLTWVDNERFEELFREHLERGHD